MADDADVQVNEITLDDFNADEQESPKAAPSVAEDKKPAEKEEVKEEAKAETEPETPEAQEPEDKVEEPVEEPETPKGKAEERKAQLNTEIRDLVAQRNALKEEVTKANAEVYQPATESELVDQGMSATDAKVEALRQQIEVKDYNDRVADAQLTISSEAQRVITDFPIFNSESKEYDKELASEAAALLEANLIYDPNTQQVIGSNVSPYQLYKTLARASQISAVNGQMKGQQDTEQMLANADVGNSATVQQKPVDPLMALWQED